VKSNPLVASGAVLVAFFTSVSPAGAQWSRVGALPVTDVFSVRVSGDTISAGVDTAAYVSTNAGGGWTRSAKPAAGVASVQCVLVRNGQLYAGTYGQGVFVSDDLGAHWSPFNTGLTGGVLDSQLFLSDLEVRRDSLYAATAGAGVYVRALEPLGAWQHFGEEFEPNQASNVNDLALGGARLLASAGGNGTVFTRDPTDADWELSFLRDHLSPGLSAFGVAWNGTNWIVGSNNGVFHRADGEASWTRANPGFGTVNWATFAAAGRTVFGAFDLATAVVIARSDDDGATWGVLEVLPDVFVYALAVSGATLYAARVDGLWQRGTGAVGVPADPAPGALRFAVRGPQPARGAIALHFELPSAGAVAIELFDVSGRRVAPIARGEWPSGPHDVALETGGLAPGVYAARLTAPGGAATARVVLVR